MPTSSRFVVSDTTLNPKKLFESHLGEGVYTAASDEKSSFSPARQADIVTIDLNSPLILTAASTIDDSDTVNSALHLPTSNVSNRAATYSSTLTADDFHPLLIYFEKLDIEPIQVNVSYSASATTATSTASNKSEQNNALIPIRFLLRAVNVTLLNIDNAPLRLSALHLQDVFSSTNDLVDLLRWHYIFQLSTGIYKLLGSSDLLGNPVGLFTSISSGMQSFFYEPAQGLLQSPAAFLEGIAKGTIGLFQHSVYGITNTTRGVLSSVAKGLSSLSQSADSRFRRRSSRLKRDTLVDRVHTAGSSLIRGSTRTMLIFAGSAVDLVGTAADSIRHAVNPTAKVRRHHPPKLFEYGLFQAKPNPTTAFVSFVTGYIAERPSQLYVAKIEGAPASLTSTRQTIVLLTSRLIIISQSAITSQQQTIQVLHDLTIANIKSIRPLRDDNGSIITPPITQITVERVGENGTAYNDEQNILVPIRIPNDIIQAICPT